MVSSWGPPTQFSPVRKSFRGRKTRCRRLNRPAKTINAIVCWFGTSCALSQIPAWDKTKLRTKVRTDRFSETHLSNLGHAGQIPVNLGQTNFNETQMSDIYWHADSPLDLGQNPVLTLLVKRPAGLHQAIIWTNAGILLIWPLATNFSEILIEINTFSLKKRHLKMSSEKWRPFVSASMCWDQHLKGCHAGLGSIPFFQFNSNSNSFTFNSNSNSNSFGMKNSNSNSNSFLSIPIPIPFYQFLFKAELNPTDNLSWL